MSDVEAGPEPEEVTVEALLARGREIRRELATFMIDMEKETAEILKTTVRTTQFVTAYIDRWNSWRSKSFLFHWKVSRLLEDSRDEYFDALRRTGSKLPTGREAATAYEERKMINEMRHISLHQRMRVLEKVDKELDLAQKHFDRKLRWLEDLRRQLRRDDDDLRFAASRDHSG